MNFFVYPTYGKKFQSLNPYISNFIDELEKKHCVVNSNAKNYGILGLFISFFGTDIYVLNWIETIPGKKFGRLQVAAFILFTWILKFSKKKLVWVLHNKGSHHRGTGGITKFMFDLLFKRSDLIITHSHAGKEFVETMYPSYVKKTHVIFHPLLPLLELDQDVVPIKYDFLIWGSVHPYKGIDKFLNFINKSEKGRDLKILIAGKCPNLKYKEKLMSLISENVEFLDRFLLLDEVAQLSNNSKFILYTYNSDTVLSSGALMDSIRMGGQVIGPNHGAFKDMAAYSFVKTYENFEDIYLIYDQYSNLNIPSREAKENFFRDNNWGTFIYKLEQLIVDLEH